MASYQKSEMEELLMTNEDTINEDIDWEDLLEEEEEEQEENEEEESEEDENSEEENEEEEELSPADIKKMRLALKKANDEAKKFRLELKKIKQTNESEDDTKVREAVEEAESKVTAKYKTRIVSSEAKALLVAAGLQSNPDRFLKMIDLDEVEIDDDGDLTGLSDQITQIKKDFPEVFKKKTGKLDTGPKDPTDEHKPKTSAEKIAAAMRGED